MKKIFYQNFLLVLMISLTVFSQNLKAQTYCAPPGTTLYSSGCSFGDDVGVVVFNTINNVTSNCPSGGYSDFTSISTTVDPGQTYTIEVGTSSPSWPQGFGVWIDYNQNGDFNDPGEYVFSGGTGSAPTTFSGSVTIPTTAVQGQTRMRVRGAYATVPSSGQSCATMSYGETEDYGIEITGGSGSGLSNFMGTFPVTCIPSAGATVTMSLSGLPTNNAGDGILTLYAAGDVDGSNENFTFYGEGFAGTGSTLGVSPSASQCGDWVSFTVIIPASDLSNWLADGQIDITATATSSVSATLCNGSSFSPPYNGSCVYATINYSYGGLSYDGAILDYFKEYTLIPHTQDPIPLMTTGSNVGDSAITNVELKTEVYDATNSLTASNTNPVIPMMAPGDSVIFSSPGIFTPNIPGIYEIEHSISIQETDDNPNNDSIRYEQEITEDIYARDAGLNNDIVAIDGQEGWIGHMFAITNSTVLRNVIFTLGSDVTGEYPHIGDSIRMEVFNMSGGLPTTLYAQTDQIVVSQPTQSTYQVTIGNSGIPLPVGDYFVAMHDLTTSASGTALAVSAVSGTTIPSEVIFTPEVGMVSTDGTNWTPFETYFGMDATSSIRIQLGCMGVQAGRDTSVCFGETVTLGGSPTAEFGTAPYTYSWSPATGLSNPSDMNPDATPSTTTTYTLTVVDATGCQIVDSVTIDVSGEIVLDPGQDTTICVGESVTLGGNPTLISGDFNIGEKIYGVDFFGGNRYIRFAHDNPENVTQKNVASVFSDMFAGDFADGIFYGLKDNDKFGMVDTLTGMFTSIGTATVQSGHGWTGLAWDQQTSTMYATSTNINTTTLYTIDLSNGASTVVANISGVPAGIWLAIDTNGNAYTLDIVSDNMFAVDLATGAGTLLGNVGFNANFAQDADFDPVTNELYLAAYNSGVNDAQLRIADLNTGATTLIGPIVQGAQAEMTAMGISPYIIPTVQWTPAASLDDSTSHNPLATPTSTTTYTLTVTDVNGCTHTETVTVTVNPLPDASITANASNSYCIENGEASLTAGTSGGTFSGTGITNQSQGIFDPAVAGAGSHWIYYEVTDINGCYNRDSLEITVYPNPTADAGLDQTICDGSSVQIGGNPTGNPAAGTFIVQYDWQPTTGLSANTDPNPVANPNTTTTYVITITDNNGCTDSDTITVNVSPNPMVNAGTDQAICDGGSVTLGGSPTVSGGTAPFTYSWSPGAGLNSVTGPNPVASPSSTTTYTLNVTDANGCSGFDVVTVTVNPNPIANAGADQTVCGGTSVTLGGNPSATGGTPGYTYSWMPGGITAANPSVAPASTTTYTLTITDASGCTDTDMVTISVNPAVNANAGANQSICYGSTTSIGGNPSGTAGSPPYTYNWTPAVGITGSSTVGNPTVAPTSTTTYTLTVTDAYGCTDTDVVTVVVNANPTVDAGSDVTICAQDAATIGGNPTAFGSTGPYSYNWSPAVGLSSTSVSNPSASPAATTKYTVTVTDANGCSTSDNLTVYVRPTPTANAGIDQSICPGGSVKIGGSPSGVGGTGALTYNWSPSLGLSSTTDPNPTATPGTTVQYILTVSDGNGCTDWDTVVVTMNTPPSPVIDDFGDEYCISDSLIQMSATPAGGTFSGPGVSGNVFDVRAAGIGLHTITYTYTDNNRCTGSDTYNIRVYDLPNVNAGPDQTVNIGESTTMNASAASNASYEWTPATYLSDPFALNPEVINPTEFVSYTLTVVTPLGCTASDVTTVNVNYNVPLNPPNTFTPNGDGINDTWRIPLIEHFPLNSMQIFNRWGQMVFEQENYNNGNAWDGADLPEGTYFYVINLVDQGDRVHKGTITIIR